MELECGAVDSVEVDFLEMTALIDFRAPEAALKCLNKARNVTI